jgi:DNA-directed RNA polymerase specialized sigma24 family protein
MIAPSLLVDPRIVTGLRAGDTRALERLFRRCHARLMEVAFAELGAGAESASGVVEHAFVRVWEEHVWFQTPEVLGVFLDSAVREAAVRERSEPGLRKANPGGAPRRGIDDSWLQLRALITSA